MTSSNPSIEGIVTGLGMALTKFEAIIGAVSDLLHRHISGVILCVTLCVATESYLHLSFNL